MEDDPYCWWMFGIFGGLFRAVYIKIKGFHRDSRWFAESLNTSTIPAIVGLLEVSWCVRKRCYTFSERYLWGIPCNLNWFYNSPTNRLIWIINGCVKLLLHNKQHLFSPPDLDFWESSESENILSSRSNRTAKSAVSLETQANKGGCMPGWFKQKTVSLHFQLGLF